MPKKKEKKEKKLKLRAVTRELYPLGKKRK